MRILSFLSSPTKLLFFLDTTKLFRNVIQKSRHFFGIGAFFLRFLSNFTRFDPKNTLFLEEGQGGVYWRILSFCQATEVRKKQ